MITDLVRIYCLSLRVGVALHDVVTHGNPNVIDKSFKSHRHIFTGGMSTIHKS